MTAPLSVERFVYEMPCDLAVQQGEHGAVTVFRLSEKVVRYADLRAMLDAARAEEREKVLAITKDYMTDGDAEIVAQAIRAK